MQTGTERGMQTMEQSLANLVLRHMISRDEALARSSHPEMLIGLIDRGVTLNGTPSNEPTLRLAEA